MPSFNLNIAALRRSKPAPPARPEILVNSLTKRAALISLEEAQQNREIVYHSVLDHVEQRDYEWDCYHPYPIKVIPLEEAQASAEIKHRLEFYEVREIRQQFTRYVAFSGIKFSAWEVHCMKMDMGREIWGDYCDN